MKQRESKKQPTRHDYAVALNTIRAQFHTIELQADTIRRQNQFMVMVWMDDRSPIKRSTFQDEAGEQSLIDHEKALGKSALRASLLGEVLGDATWQPTFVFYMGYPKWTAHASPRRSIESVIL